MKQPINFRLSTENKNFIKTFSDKFGFTQTEFIEFVLMLVRTQPEFFIKSFSSRFKKVITETNKKNDTSD